MTKHRFDKIAAIKKIYQKPRASKDIYSDYMNHAATVGDKTLALSLAQENLEKLQTERDELIEKMCELKGEHDSAIALEAKEKADTPQLPVETTATDAQPEAVAQ